MTANRNAIGGKLQASYQTEETCKSACTRDATCLALDFDTTNTRSERCYFFTDANYLLNTGAKLGTNHYRKKPDCGGKTTPGERYEQFLSDMMASEYCWLQIRVHSLM